MCEMNDHTGYGYDEQIGDLTAIILAGGLGTRLRTIVNDRPKVLAMVAGRPFGEWVVMGLRAVGIRHLIFCTGYLGEMVREHFQDGSTWGMTIDYSHEKELLGTGGALRHCLSLVRSDPVLVMNGDSYCGVNISEYLQWHVAIPRVGSMVVVKTDNPERFGTVQMAGDGSIKDFKEKTIGSEVSWINAGIYLLSRQILESIPLEQAVSLEREILTRWVGKGLWGFPNFGAFGDMGTPQGMREAEDFFSLPVT